MAHGCAFAGDQVWVLEVEDGGDAAAAPAWVKRYTVLAHGGYPPRHYCQEIALPHVAHGEHVLTIGEPWTEDHQALEAHRPMERNMKPRAGHVGCRPSAAGD